MRFVDVLIVIVGGFIAGMTIRGGGPMIALGSMIGVRLSMRTLYTPMLIVSCLVLLRVVLALRPRIHFSGTLMPSRPVLKAAAVGMLAMLLPLSPVLYAFGERLAFDNGVGTPVYWRSSPPGVDLLAFVLPNPNHPLWGAADPGPDRQPLAAAGRLSPNSPRRFPTSRSACSCWRGGAWAGGPCRCR